MTNAIQSLTISDLASVFGGAPAPRTWAELQARRHEGLGAVPSTNGFGFRSINRGGTISVGGWFHR